MTIISASNLPNADGRNIKAKFDSLMRTREKNKDLSGETVQTLV